MYSTVTSIAQSRQTVPWKCANNNFEMVLVVAGFSSWALHSMEWLSS